MFIDWILLNCAETSSNCQYGATANGLLGRAAQEAVPLRTGLTSALAISRVECAFWGTDVVVKTNMTVE